MKKYLIIFLFIFTFSYPVISDEGQYIVYETGLVIPSGADEISFKFTGINLENEIRDMEEIRRNLFLSKRSATFLPTIFKTPKQYQYNQHVIPYYTHCIAAVSISLQIVFAIQKCAILTRFIGFWFYQSLPLQRN